MKKIILMLTACTLIFSHTFGKEREARLMRFPHISNNTIAFSYAGDIYTVSSDGGEAKRITSHIGYEMFPRISPDGKLIAFTGQYDGNTEVYIIPVNGGEPKRLTYTATLSRDDIGDRMGPNNIVIGWSPDGQKILFRTRNYTFNDFTGQLMTISKDGGEPEFIPLKNGGFASFSPDGKKLAYNYIFREFRTWKRYRGGMADDIRIFDFDTKESVNITNNNAQDIIPMWSNDGKKVFYISDSDNHMNLYSYNTETKKQEKLTSHVEYDIKFPSIGGEYIVYENGGYIYKFNTNTSKEEKVNIRIGSDNIYARDEWKDLSGSIRSLSLSPNGERVLVGARGDIFSLPAKEGVTYNLTNNCSANEMGADWAPDGKGFAYISDIDGEFNIYYQPTNGTSPKKLTNIKSYIFGFEWSPDSKWIAWSEKSNTLNLLNIETGDNRVIERSEISPINDYRWSPDSKIIAYTLPGKSVSSIYVYDITSKEKTRITDQWYSSFSPAFSKDGKYLLFVSSRTFNPTYSSTEWNHVYTNMNKIYILPIAEGAEPIFMPKNDTVATNGSATKSKETSKEAIKYNFSSVEERLTELPVEPSSYGNLHMIGESVYYGSRRGMFVFDINSKKETALNANLIFSAGYKKALAFAKGGFQVIDIPKGAVTLSKPISLKGVKKLVNFGEEWMQIYNETWRQMRDFFYAKNMHGVDWEKVGKKYRELVPYVKHRSDLTYILGEMIGELNVGHAYSQNGEHPQAPRVKMGLLGAQFSKDKSGYFKVNKIIKGANWSKDARSPLTMPGVDVKEGEYIIAINGKSVKEAQNIYSYLAGTAGELTEITVNNTPSIKGSRNVLVTPIADESQLYYINWVENNIKKVNEATNGEVGYIHIPDMGVTGLNEFVKHYYPQLTKKALIIDDRGNGGGNVSPMIIERLQRTITFFTMHTNQKEGSLNPVGTFQGPKVLLINEYSASDGDLFPYRFKFNKLGTVIGRRSWGGVVGYSGTVPVVDGGSIVTPSYAPFAEDGSGWIIEGEGVHPHIELFNDPYKEFNGADDQLSRAIEEAIKQMKEYKYKKATIPPFPVK